MTPQQPVKTAPKRESSSRAAYMRDYRRTLQARTLPRSDRSLTPWSLADDQILTDGPGTVLERAVRLRRSYFACLARLAALRDAQEATG